ncbi:MAG: alanine--glyoxylate aminotransferase family protein [Anaerolineae bacterium]|nr:alanine--glyoxylate aminotransferase family protein [Anaerolineae bacterium]
MGNEFDHEYLFIPGPVEVRREVLDAQGEWMIGHRSKAFAALYARLQPRLKRSFGAGEGYRVYTYTSSGSGIWESASRNLVRDDRRILHLVNGAFSDRWAKVSSDNGKQADVIEVPWGQAVKPEQLAEALSQQAYDAVALVYNETSTGVLNPLPEYAEIVRQYDDTLLLVDAVSCWLGLPIEAAAWGCDMVLASSQKAFALPPGIAFGAVSDRALVRAEQVPHRGYYFDMLTLEKSHVKNNTPATPPISLMYAADKQFDDIEGEGYPARYARHQQLAEMTRAWALDRGFAMFSEAGYHSPTVSAIENTRGIDFPALQAFLQERGMYLGGGYGKLKATTFRIAHMGDTQPEHMQMLFDGIDSFLGA